MERGENLLQVPARLLSSLTLSNAVSNRTCETGVTLTTVTQANGGECRSQKHYPGAQQPVGMAPPVRPQMCGSTLICGCLGLDLWDSSLAGSHCVSSCFLSPDNPLQNLPP